MSILLHRTYRIFILDDNDLIDYERVKNNIKFFEKWIKDLKKDLNRQYKIIFDRLESLKGLRGEIEKLKGEIKIGNLSIPLYSDRVNKSIRIIFSIVNNTNIIIVWGIGYHEEAYRDILRRAESFIKNHKELILNFLGIKTIYR
ncbi:hypothetical protein DDW05_03340 [Candidatus Nanobsidianus stetteri]|uniref:Uncharacterized protein n=1 Tax=Nanobsidianus stetteri TaxID=1294122 RepID=A0A2T9WPE2_NANST|nr:hypothetical protein DDW05_03340 [Candidatus Nanobsidianus stetteri]